MHAYNGTAYNGLAPTLTLPAEMVAKRHATTPPRNGATPLYMYTFVRTCIIVILCVLRTKEYICIYLLRWRKAPGNASWHDASLLARSVARSTVGRHDRHYNVIRKCGVLRRALSLVLFGLL